MDESVLEFLISMRKEMFAGSSNKREEITNKLDELILVELNKPTPTTQDDDIPF